MSASTTGRIAAPVPPSATLAINERIEQRVRNGDDVLHLAFGEAGLPLLDSIAEVLARAAPRTSYGSVAGSAEARAAAAGWYERRGLPTTPGQIVFAPGSKPLLYALVTVLPGDVVIPQPSWVSYAAHAALAGKRVVTVPIGAEAGGAPDPDALEDALATSARTWRSAAGGSASREWPTARSARKRAAPWPVSRARCGRRSRRRCRPSPPRC